jgi:hypothetical protein
MYELSVCNSDLSCPIYHHNLSRLPARTSVSMKETGVVPDVERLAPPSCAGLEIEGVANLSALGVSVNVGASVGSIDGVALGSL